MIDHIFPERTGYLSAEELAAVQVLHKRAPYSVTGISSSIFSLARHDGMMFQGCHYSYIPAHDECVRDDVLTFVMKLRNVKAKKAHAEQRAAQKAAQKELGV